MADNINILDSAGGTKAVRAKDNTSVWSFCHVPVDATGTPYDISNPMAMFGSPVASITAQVSLARVAAAASTNATSVKASAGNVYGYSLFNNAAYDVFLKWFNKASAPSVGSDTIIFTLVLPSKGGVIVPTGAIPLFPLTTGIAYCITKLIADSDTTAVALNDVHGAIWYK